MENNNDNVSNDDDVKASNPVQRPLKFAIPLAENSDHQNPIAYNYMPPVEYFFSTPVRKPNKNSKKKNPYNKRKTCGCKNSQCLKLYCKCFANGEYCQNCGCKDCQNSFTSIERSKAIKTSLEKNPNAFNSKIGVGKKKGYTERVHVAGCQCKKSNCMKNYCECYEAKVACSDRCKCVSCRNTEYDRENLLCDKFPMMNDWDKSSSYDEEDFQGTSKTPIVFPWVFITNDVIEATCNCLLTRALNCENKKISEIETINSLCEELGNAFAQIFNSAQEMEKYENEINNIIKNEINDGNK